MLWHFNPNTIFVQENRLEFICKLEVILSRLQCVLLLHSCPFAAWRWISRDVRQWSALQQTWRSYRTRPWPTCRPCRSTTTCWSGTATSGWMGISSISSSFSQRITPTGEYRPTSGWLSVPSITQLSAIHRHYNDVIMGAIASQITSLASVTSAA